MENSIRALDKECAFSFEERIKAAFSEASYLYHELVIDDDAFLSLQAKLLAVKELYDCDGIADLDLLDEIEVDLDACIDAVAPYRLG